MSSHPNRTPFRGQAPTQEFHKFHFKGCWIPASVFDLITAGKLVAHDLAILTMIDALSHPNGRGCYASNAYLATQLSLSKRSVIRSINRLKALGLVLSTGTTSNRELRPSWDSASDKSVTSASDKSVTQKLVPTELARRKGEAGGETPPRGTPNSRRSTHPTNPSTSVPKGGSLPVNPQLGNCPPNPRDKAPKCPVEEVDRSRARRLKEYVRNQGWSLSASPKNWEQAFAILRRRPAICATQIDSVLDYLTLHHPRDAKPRIRNARELIDRWDWLTDLAEKNKPVTVSPIADNISNRLANLGWPKGSEAKLPEAVQKSLDAFTAFQAKLKPFVKQPEPTDKRVRRLWNFAKEVWASSLDSAPWFVENYFVRLHKRVRGWSGWSGSFAPWLFTLPKLVDEGRGWSVEYCGVPNLWDQLLKEIGCEG